MIHPLLSLRARARHWQSRHFQLTPSGRRLAGLKGIHAGARCFFIGNGPSLRAEDLTRLHERGEVCFAFNRVYHIFDETPWRPDFYISQDERMLRGCAEAVERTAMGVKLIPVNCKWYHGIRLHGVLWFWMKAPAEAEGKPLEFSDEPPRCLYQASTGMYTAAQLAVYMGFREIYLLGVDHHFRVSQNNRGEIVVDEAARDYFTERYNEDRDVLYIPNTEKSTLTYEAMREQCERRGVAVYNATRGGRLELFPRVDFDTLF